MNRLLVRSIISLIALLILLITNRFASPLIPNKHILQISPTSSDVLPAYSQITTVTRVIDGDTIQIDTGQKVRYIGIDTPELHKPRTPVQCFAKEAYEKNRNLVEGKKVKLVKDVSETDKYGRLLRYVYLQDQPSTASSEGLFVNEYLVKEGYAHAATFPPDVAFSDHFVKLQDGARNENKGLWSNCY